MANPLLALTGLPPFSKIKPEHVEPAIGWVLAENRKRIAELTGSRQAPNWEHFIEPLEELDDLLNRTWSPISHLNSVVNSDQLREVYNRCLPKLSDYATELGHNEDLFRGYQAVARSAAKLNPAQRKLLENALRDFHLSGVDLPPEKKARFKVISQELSQLTAKYEENLLDATNAWSKLVEDESALAGLPDSAKALARQNAEQRGQEGWLLNLEFPSYLPVVTYADHRQLRREAYQAYATRASDQGPYAGRWDNGENMERILALRHEMAQLLGFANYAALSLEPKMARTTREVMDFLEDLGRRSYHQAQRELAELEDFASERFGVAELEAWDIPYYSEKLRRERYRITQEELRPYFPETRVLPGMFAVVERLFGIHFTEIAEFDRWHPDVRFFEIRDHAGGLRGQFYLDLYARQKKRGGAWMGECTSRMFTACCDQIPVAYLVCNFSPPVGDRPALFTHDEVQTLFHEFGHGLHHMLTLIDYPPVAGISGVPWDAVELPSQFLENWCWEKESLALIAAHVDTGEPLPEPLYQRMTAAKNFQSAMQMARQLEFALFDFRLHLEYDPARGGRIYEILEQVREQVAVVRPPAFNRFAHGFSHIFAGGYAAGYYSYKWAEVLSADAFSLFEEQGVFAPEAGRSFLTHILEKGGSEDAMDLFVAFRGREPEIDALLRHSGIAAWLMLRHTWTGALLMLATTAVEGAYVTDQLTVGLFQDPAQTERPVRALTAGTPLEILQRRGTYTQVRLGDRQTGWLETRYLTEDKPLKVRLIEAQAKFGQTWKQLQALERELADRDGLIADVAQAPDRSVAVNVTEPQTADNASTLGAGTLGTWLLAGAGTALGFLGGLAVGLFRA